LAHTVLSLPKVSGAQSSISDSHGARHLSAEICGHAEADSSSGETRSEATQRGPHLPKVSVAISSPLCPAGISPKGEKERWSAPLALTFLPETATPLLEAVGVDGEGEDLAVGAEGCGQGADDTANGC